MRHSNKVIPITLFGKTFYVNIGLPIYHINAKLEDIFSTAEGAHDATVTKVSRATISKRALKAELDRIYDEIAKEVTIKIKEIADDDARSD